MQGLDDRLIDELGEAIAVYMDLYEQRTVLDAKIGKQMDHIKQLNELNMRVLRREEKNTWTDSTH
jgi:hypothetical protein